MTRKIVDSRQVFFDFNAETGIQKKAVPLSLEELVLINSDPAFGFDNIRVADKTANLFRRRSELEDNLNLRLINGAYLGYMQVEAEGVHGIPIEVLQQLNTYDIVALYYGIHLLKGKNQDLGGSPFGKLIYILINEGYAENGNLAQNAIRAMKQQEVGFTGHRDRNPTIEESMDMLDDKIKLQFLRAFYTPMLGIQDDIYNMVPNDSNQARNLHVREFIGFIRRKHKAGNIFEDEGFHGWLVQSNSSKEKVYFVQSNVLLYGTNKGKEIYSCSCPHGYRKMYGGLSGNAPPECAHIKSIKENLVTRDSLTKLA